MAYYKLWVAEDGSTYPAFKYDTDGDGFINTGQVRLAAEYAMHYEEAFVLAQPVSAYGARKELASGTDKQKHEAARSPAVDAADDNAYDYDTTSTLSVKRLESLRENFPENYHPDTVIDMGQPDIGYHYLRRIADDDPIMNPLDPEEQNPNRKVMISFKQPRENLFTVQQYNVYEYDTDNEVWTYRTFIPGDLHEKFLQYDIKGFMTDEDNYHLQLRTEDETNSESENNPEIHLIIDESF